jgi:hypothetical protein
VGDVTQIGVRLLPQEAIVEDRHRDRHVDLRLLPLLGRDDDLLDAVLPVVWWLGDGRLGIRGAGNLLRERARSLRDDDQSHACEKANRAPPSRCPSRTRRDAPPAVAGAGIGRK